MNEQPTVCCVMLVNGREEMVKRAVRSFQAQTYVAKQLLVYDTGPDSVEDLADHVHIDQDDTAIEIVESRAVDHHGNRKSIGYLRNRANHAAKEALIILHWDSDDWSHPQRIAEQVALLQASGKDCVGYRELLFARQAFVFDDSGKYERHEAHRPTWEAWLYSQSRERYCVGTSLCYWRRVWEQRPFEDLPRPGGGTGEDTKWLEGVSSLGVSSLGHCAWLGESSLGAIGYVSGEPRMIASIHGANTNAANYRECLAGNSPQWRRVPAWDEHVRAIMERA